MLYKCWITTSILRVRAKGRENYMKSLRTNMKLVFLMIAMQASGIAHAACEANAKSYFEWIFSTTPECEGKTAVVTNDNTNADGFGHYHISLKLVCHEHTYKNTFVWTIANGKCVQFNSGPSPE
jgi:hypothetical protein